MNPSNPVPDLTPWEAEPYRLWSLELMLRHYAGNWLAVTANLVRLRWLHTLALGDDPTAADELEKTGPTILDLLKTEFQELPFSSSLRKQFERTMETLSGGKSWGDDHRISIVLIDELIFNMQAELDSQLFLCVSSHRKAIYLAGREAFGADVLAAFPKAATDIKEAATCLALDRWTACVTHSMRVLQHALIRFGEYVGLPPEDLKKENWKNVIDQIERKIREMEALPKSSPLKSDVLRACSGAAAQFRYIKDAWRNHVTHGEDTYSESDADAVYAHTRDFMKFLVRVCA